MWCHSGDKRVDANKSADASLRVILENLRVLFTCSAGRGNSCVLVPLSWDCTAYIPSASTSPSYVNNENLEILTRYSPLRDFNRFTPLKDCLSCFMISVDKGPLVLKILLSRVGYHKPAYRLQSKLIAIPTRSEVHISPICLVGRLSGVSLRIKHLVMNLVITNLK